MPTFVFEIGTEEIPARFLGDLEREMADRLANLLDEAHVDHGEIAALSTPRRLAVTAKDVAEVQKEVEEEISGPPVRVAYDADGNPTKAALGFAKTQGVDLADAYTVETDKGEYLAVRKKSGGAKTVDLLADVCKAIVLGLPFPKKMHWGDRDLTFARPVRWFLAMLGNEPVTFSVEDIASGDVTFGHRVMGPGPFQVPTADEYQAVVADACKVVLDPAVRRATIREQGDALAAEANAEVVWKESLMDEVCGLVESPRVVMGTFDASFLELPDDVLLTSMQSHQKSFGVRDKATGKLLNHFMSTLNLEPLDLALVQKGWERVLRARLEDGRFFWKADLAQDFDTWLGKLENVTFMGPLGSMGDKSRRIEAVCGRLAGLIAPGDADVQAAATRAGRLAKADLVSEMVGEFDSLQGIMGGIYARKKGETDAVADAIADHYLPAGPDTELPATLCGALVSMADKADTLVGCFGLGKIPSGANDPFALRRAVLGMARILVNPSDDMAPLKHLDMLQVLELALEAYGDQEWKLAPDEIKAKLGEFVAQRLRNYFAGLGYETLLVDAALGAGFGDVYGLGRRLEALAGFRMADDFEQAVLTFKRAANIIRKQGDEAGEPLTGAYQAATLEEPQEKALAEALEALIPRFEDLWTAEDYNALMGLLRELRPTVDAFFDNVMVMCEDTSLRLNRLNLLKALVDRLGRLADFNALQV